MIGTVILVIVSVLLIGALKGIADTIQSDPEYRENGWKAKWKDAGERIEKFPFSSTALVFLTDRWHLVNFIQYRIVDGWITYWCYCSLFPSWKSIICLLIIPVIRWTGFKTTFRK